MANQPHPTHSGSIEDVLTWEEANTLRILVNDHRRDLLAQALLAEAEGHDSKVRKAKLAEAVQIENKVTAMFYRLSEA